ncbi:MAG TPA: MFS transporter [Candidatus Binataceae bacterium]|nr:MFS transporter [Candidatus Binataceae bacterium]
MKQRHRAWLMVAALWLIMALLYGSGASVTGLFYKPLSSFFHTTRAQISLLSSLFGIGACVGSLTTGWLLGRLNPRYAMALGAVLEGTGFLLAYHVHSFHLLLLCYGMVGAGVGLSTLIPSALIVGNWFGARPGLAMGVAMTGPTLGGSVIVMVISASMAHWGWRTSYLLLMTPALLALPVIYLLRSHPEGEFAPRQTHATLAPGLEVAQAVRTREFWLIVLAQLICGSVANGILAHLVVYLQGLSYPTHQAAAALSAALALTFVGKISLGAAADHLGSRLTVMIDALVEASAAILLIGAARGFILVAAVGAFGISWSAPVALLPLLTIESLGLRRYGGIAGLTMVAYTAGSALGPYTAGRVFDATAGYNAAFIAFAIAAVTAGLAVQACRPLAVISAGLPAPAQPSVVGA